MGTINAFDLSVIIAYMLGITAIGIQWDCMVNLFGIKRLSIDTLMSGLAALTTRTLGLFDCGRLNDIRGRRFGRVRRIVTIHGSSDLSVNGLTPHRRCNIT